MKKKLGLIMFLVLAVSLIVGCSAKQQTSDNGAQPNEQTQAVSNNDNQANNNNTANNNNVETQQTLSTGYKEMDSQLTSLDNDLKNLESSDGALDSELSSI